MEAYVMTLEDCGGQQLVAVHQPSYGRIANAIKRTADMDIKFFPRNLRNRAPHQASFKNSGTPDNPTYSNAVAQNSH